MGQYRLWLHYREIDQHLGAQLKTREAELAKIDEEITRLEATTSLEDNAIIGALFTQLYERDTPASMALPPVFSQESPVSTAITPVLSAELAETTGADAATWNEEKLPVNTVSPALFAWSNLPNFDSQNVQPTASTPSRELSQVAPDPAANLLPTDISAFVEAHNRTFPQVQIPWWLRETLQPPPLAEESHQSNPVDQQSKRTNQLVQRWFARWEQTADETLKAQEGQADEH